MTTATTTTATTNEQNTRTSKGDHDKLPVWHYVAPTADQKEQLPGQTIFSLPPLDGERAMDLGDYCRPSVSNVDVDATGRAYFDMGLRLMLSYQHEMASKCFLACLQHCPDCALAHGMIALCHSPNYNFRGEAYYESASHEDDVNKCDLLCHFPSQQVADRHSQRAVEKVESLRKTKRGPKKGKSGKKGAGSGGPGNGNSSHNSSSSYGRNGTSNGKNGEGGESLTGASNVNASENNSVASPTPSRISDVEAGLLAAIRILTSCAGVDYGLSEETVGRPYADAMRKLYQKYPEDPDIAYWFAEALMVLNAWQLYEYPSGKPVSPDVVEIRAVLEQALQKNQNHAGLCHLYVHLSEMSGKPDQALAACKPLRTAFPHAGHLIHMGTHIDVLVGDYVSVVQYNCKASIADSHAMKSSPSTAGFSSFYFGYITHNYHMAAYGCILAGMEAKGMEIATEMNGLVNEEMFQEFPDLTSYLEAYSALDVHVLIRFGRWKELLELTPPKDKRLMLYRASSILFGRALALAATGETSQAKKEADRLDTLRKDPSATMRILHNNTVSDLLAVDATMLRGEIAYREGKHEDAFTLLRKAVKMQDNLNYDEPWGKMQPIRHALGGLLLEQGKGSEAEEVFRRDLEFHPKNPWALIGLINCLKARNDDADVAAEISSLEDLYREQRQSEWADYDVAVACECCQRCKA